MMATEHDSEKAQSSNSSQNQVAKDPNLVDFDGPDDPENPINWSSGKKTTQILIVMVMTVLSPVGSTINSASTLDILKHFNSTNRTIGTFATTIFLLGYTFGPMVIAPLSELYGRAIMYKTCMFFFIVFNVACAVSNSLGSLVAYRFLAGAMGSCSMTIGTGSIADIFQAEKRTAAMGAYVISITIGPTIGPIIGGFLAPVAGWRWAFWVVAIASACVTVVVILFISESYPYAILEHKARRLRKETGNMDLRSVLHTGKTPKSLFTYSITRPVKMLLSPIVFSLSLYVATLYAYLYLCFTTFEVVFSRQYGFSSGEAGLANLGIGLGSALGCVVCSVAANDVSRKLAEKHGGDPKPEYQLPIMILGGFCTPIGLFWYGWSAYAKVHWIVPIIGSSFIGMGMAFTFMPTTLYLVELYTVHAASVTAANTILRCLLGALLPLAGTSLYDSLGLGWANSLLGFISIAFFPVPFILYLYGERLRNIKVLKVEF